MIEKKKSFIVFTIFILLFPIVNFTYANGFDEDIFTNFVNREVPGNSSVEFNFVPWSNKLSLSVENYVNLSYSFLSSIFSRQISLKINNSKPIDLNLDLRLNLKDFNISNIPSVPELLNFTFELNFKSVYKFYSNSSIDKIEIRMLKKEFYGLNPEKNYSMAYVKKDQDSWNLIPTLEKTDESTNETYLESTLQNTEANETYFLTLIEPKSNQFQNPPNLIWVWFIIIPAALIIGLIIVISKEDYIKYIKTRLVDIQKGTHQLTLDEVLENKNRMKIIDLILNKPGIHFNELLRETELSPGNLVWHLDILETYKIIGKKRISNYVVYIPYYDKNPLSNIDIKLQKSELTLEVLNIIENNPGIWNSKIANKLDTHRKTISYHVKKLLDLDLIYRKKEGLRMKIYPKLEKEYFRES